MRSLGKWFTAILSTFQKPAAGSTSRAGGAAAGLVGSHNVGPWPTSPTCDVFCNDWFQAVPEYKAPVTDLAPRQRFWPDLCAMAQLASGGWVRFLLFRKKCLAIPWIQGPTACWCIGAGPTLRPIVIRGRFISAARTWLSCAWPLASLADHSTDFPGGSHDTLIVLRRLLTRVQSI